MLNSSERRREFKGPIFYSHGFRSFFMFAGIWASFAMLVWVIFLATGRTIPSDMAGVDWHMHEMLFGYSSAVIAGFLLTAVPNWTGRMPIIGWPTALLSGLWLLGRGVMFFSEYLPNLVAPIIDISFLLVFAAVIAREILAGNNTRNLKVLILVGLLAIANIIFHIEAANGTAFEGYGVRMGIGLIIMLLALIGGRVIPSFSRNWLSRQKPGRLPVPFNSYDKAVLAVTGATLAVWIVLPEHMVTQALSLFSAALHFVRLYRWAGWRTFSEPLVAILHVGYFFVPLGFLMLGLGDILPGFAGAMRIPHAWMAGGVGIITLAMMTRASLGHSGRPLKSTPAITTIYALVIAAVLFRITAEMVPFQTWLLHASATTWILGFALYVVIYFPIFTKPRQTT